MASVRVIFLGVYFILVFYILGALGAQDGYEMIMRWSDLSSNIQRTLLEYLIIKHWIIG